MIWLNILSIIIVILLIIAADKISTYKHKDLIVIIIAWSLFISNILKFMFEEGYIPVEYSAISYFVIPIIFILKIKPLYIWNVYCGMLSGFFYFALMITQASVIYESYALVGTIVSLYCHGAVLFLSLLYLKSDKFDIKTRYILIIGNLIILVYVFLIREYANLGYKLFIYEILDGYFVGNDILRYIYYVALTFFLIYTTKLIFNINNKLYKLK